MRRKKTRDDYSKMSLSEPIFRKGTSNIELDEGSSLKGILTMEDSGFSFRVRSDGALLLFKKRHSSITTVYNNSHVFKFRNGGRTCLPGSHAWVRKRTPDGITMGIRQLPSKYVYIPGNQLPYVEVFNELEVKLIRAARLSLLKKSEPKGTK